MAYFREIQEQLETKLNMGKILVLTGPRQVGKTTLLKSFLQARNIEEYDFDLFAERKVFAEPSRIKLQRLIESIKEQEKDCIFIDEVQKEPEAFNAVKFIYDNLSPPQIILSGSTILELEKSSLETLTGRAVFMNLLPLSPVEVYHQVNRFERYHRNYLNELKLRGAEDILERMVRYGSYPEVYFSNQPEALLQSLAESISIKDVKVAERNKEKFAHLLRLLALQVSSLVSIDELASLTELTKPTVYEYIEQLERLFIVHRCEPLNLSERKAISRGFKIYFWDLGLRNYFANDFTELDQNPNNGALFENFVVNNFKRKNIYHGLQQRIGFFRNKNQAEIDIVIKEADRETVYECKLSKETDTIPSKLLGREINCINRHNWMDYL